LRRSRSGTIGSHWSRDAVPLKPNSREEGPVAGKHLIAFLVPDPMAGDLDLTNNRAAVLLSE
jgi:hypothetical protein